VPAPGVDRIELRGLRLVGICGALPEERDRAQPLEVDLDVEVDLSAAGTSDDLADTVDYGAIGDRVADAVAAGSPRLLEHLAADVAGAVLGVDARIDAVEVAVRKLRPPVPHDLASSGVRIRRGRP
jgi:7,8-dihydroneopterin aldolase/epimerase/oxygenase